MATLALIVPRRTSEKHPSNPLARSQRFLNFGALALGTYLDAKGHDVSIIDEYALPETSDTFAELTRLFGSDGPQAIGLSCISAYSADRAEALVRTFREIFPRSILISGGQHFAGLWGETFEQRFPGTSVLIGGEAEKAFEQVLHLIDKGIAVRRWTTSDLPQNVWFVASNKIARGTRRSEIVQIDGVVCANYALYPAVRDLFPSLEFSRGCAYACVFCANTTDNRKNFRRASDPALRRALDGMAQYFHRPSMGFYMQASDFFVSEKEALALSDAFSRTDYPFAWRTEVRVDEITPESLRLLHEAGLRYLDVGLESASKATLLVMNKTKHPDIYLKRAAKLLAAASGLGIFTKVNFLIHPGDIPSSVEESIEWLKSHRESISGISSGVTLEYVGTPLSNRLADFAARFGTKRRPHELSRWGVYNLDPSLQLPLEEAENLARRTAKEMQTREAFARSKSFGYLPSEIELQSTLAALPEADHTTPYS